MKTREEDQIEGIQALLNNNEAISQTWDFQPFSEEHWMGYAGAESPNPFIAHMVEIYPEHTTEPEAPESGDLIWDGKIIGWAGYETGREIFREFSSVKAAKDFLLWIAPSQSKNTLPSMEHLIEVFAFQPRG